MLCNAKCVFNTLFMKLVICPSTILYIVNTFCVETRFLHVIVITQTVAASKTHLSFADVFFFFQCHFLIFVYDPAGT